MSISRQGKESSIVPGLFFTGLYSYLILVVCRRGRCEPEQWDLHEEPSGDRPQRHSRPEECLAWGQPSWQDWSPPLDPPLFPRCPRKRRQHLQRSALRVRRATDHPRGQCSSFRELGFDGFTKTLLFPARIKTGICEHYRPCQTWIPTAQRLGYTWLAGQILWRWKTRSPAGLGQGELWGIENCKATAKHSTVKEEGWGWKRGLTAIRQELT